MKNEEFRYEELDTKAQQFSSQVFTSNKGYIKCNGYIQPVKFQKFAQQIRDMDIRDDDIWVCGFPKTGSTWVQEMIWGIIKGLDDEDTNKYIYERSPLLDFSFLYDVNLWIEHPNDSPYKFLANSVDYVEKLASPRIIKTHLPFELLPKKLKNFSTNAKIIRITRNPRDTLISSYYYLKLLRGSSTMASLQEYAEMIFQGNVPFAQFSDHVRGYLKYADNPNLLLLQYEDLKKDLKSVIDKTCIFLGRNIDEAEVDRLLEHLSFSAMKDNPAVNHEEFLQFRKKCNSMDDDGCFMRRGVVGDWKQEVDFELYKKFVKWEEETLKGIHFTYSI